MQTLLKNGKNQNCFDPVAVSHIIRAYKHVLSEALPHNECSYKRASLTGSQWRTEGIWHSGQIGPGSTLLPKNLFSLVTAILKNTFRILFRCHFLKHPTFLMFSCLFGPFISLFSSILATMQHPGRSSTAPSYAIAGS